jgi:hypothetical protein
MKRHYVTWVANSLNTPARSAGTRLFLDENAELLYVFNAGSITAYTIATSEFGSAGMGTN